MCKNERCFTISLKESEFCDVCKGLAALPDMQIVSCKWCGEEYLIRNKFLYEDKTAVGICRKCQLEIKRREREDILKKGKGGSGNFRVKLA